MTTFLMRRRMSALVAQHKRMHAPSSDPNGPRTIVFSILLAAAFFGSAALLLLRVP